MATARGCWALTHRASGRAAAWRLRPGGVGARGRDRAAFGYGEINLNCGCPSDRVQSGRFGACLMAEPGLSRPASRRCAARLATMFRSPSNAGSASTTRTARPNSPVHRFRRGCRLPRFHRACPQGLASGPEPQGEPRSSAARLRSRLPAQVGLS